MNEAEVRILINKQLRDAGWRLRGDKSPNVRAEQQIRGKDGENLAADYALMDDNNSFLAVLEAKKDGTDALAGKDQARQYAEASGAPFVILSNGKEHYFWEVGRGEPHPVRALPSQKDILRRRGEPKKQREFLSEHIGADYMADVQGANCPPHKRRPLREYQMEAVCAVQNAADGGARKFLLEMATGTGKTLVSAALIKLFLITGNARRVLFIVDRLELEDQARANFEMYFGNAWQTVVYKENRADWNKAEVVVSTVQSLGAGDKYKKFSPLDFDLMIVDEAHRAICGTNARRVFDYFSAYKLGLTATPRDYLRNAAGAGDRDREMRQLRDTYRTFGCEPGAPTFHYGLKRGVREDYLVPARNFVARTNITTQLLSELGFSFAAAEDDGGRLVGPAEGGEKAGPYKTEDYEKKFFSDATNEKFCRAFIDRALRDPISDDIGKTIVYCASQRHAAKVAKILNDIAADKFPGKYNSDFAKQTTSQVDGAAEYRRQFANNNLGGKTLQPDGYDSCKTRVCVAVGMMTTGYDCPDILNICLMRPIFSPSDFIQMRGRGTRKHTFQYDAGPGKTRQKEKDGFALFDFFAVCEYFEKDFNYDEKLSLSADSEERRGDDSAELPPPEDRAGAAVYQGEDEIVFIGEIYLSDGMRIDEDMHRRIEDKLAADDELRDAVAQNRMEDAEKICRDKYAADSGVLQQMTARHAARLDRRVDIGEVLQLLFDIKNELPNREDMLDTEAQKFAGAALETLGTEERYAAAELFKACLHNPQIAGIVEREEWILLADYPIEKETLTKAAPVGKHIVLHIKTAVDKTTMRRLAR